jgi:LSD1 subclass zinc finger protein
MESTENCGVCGTPLVYGKEPVPVRCAFCGEEQNALIYCPEGHYVCDACHGMAALDVLRDVLASTTSTDPIEIFETVTSHPSVPMHGPEHHAIVPAVIVAAVRNAGYPVPEGAVERAIERGSQVPGGWCGSHGVCGAATGVGTAISVLTGATPLTGRTRGLANEATSLVLRSQLDNGPRCCKRASRHAIETAVKFLEDRLGIHLETTPDIKCRYVERNRECIRKACPYYGGNGASKA